MVTVGVFKLKFLFAPFTLGLGIAVIPDDQVRLAHVWVDFRVIAFVQKLFLYLCQGEGEREVQIALSRPIFLSLGRRNTDMAIKSVFLMYFSRCISPDVVREPVKNVLAEFVR